MSDKTKAAMPGRQCGYACQREKITKLAAGGQKGSYRGCSTADAKLRSRENQRVNCYQPFGSMPRCFNSARPSSFNQLPRLTPSFWASFSNCAFSSGLMRIWKGGDLPAPRGWLSRTIISFSVDMCTPMGLSLISLGVHTNMCRSKKTTPQSAGTLLRRLTSTDK